MVSQLKSYLYLCARKEIDIGFSMAKDEIYNEFWASVPESEKPQVLAMFYYDMTDSQKDKFLEETGQP